MRETPGKYLHALPEHRPVPKPSGYVPSDYWSKVRRGEPDLRDDAARRLHVLYRRAEAYAMEAERLYLSSRHRGPGAAIAAVSQAWTAVAELHDRLRGSER